MRIDKIEKEKVSWAKIFKISNKNFKKVLHFFGKYCIIPIGEVKIIRLVRQALLLFISIFKAIPHNPVKSLCDIALYVFTSSLTEDI